MENRLLPGFLNLPFAWVLSWTEVVCGLALLFGVLTRYAGMVSAGMMGMFIVATGASLARGLDIDCGCFDIPLLGPSTIGWHTLFRNVILLAMSLSVVMVTRRNDE